MLSAAARIAPNRVLSAAIGERSQWNADAANFSPEPTPDHHSSPLPARALLPNDPTSAAALVYAIGERRSMRLGEVRADKTAQHALRAASVRQLVLRARLRRPD